MADELDDLLPKILPLLRMLDSGSDGEIVNSVRALRRILITAGLDTHAIADRLEESTMAGMQKIYQAGYDQRRIDEVEERRRNTSMFSSGMSAYRGYQYSANDFAGGVGGGINGYSWHAIAQHCAARIDSIPRPQSRDREFVESIAEQLDYALSQPTPRQAKWLRDIFNKYFQGKID